MRRPARNLMYTMITIVYAVTLARGVGLQIPKLLKVLAATSTTSASAARDQNSAALPESVAESVLRPLQLQADRRHYEPGEVVIFTGSGWRPGEMVVFSLHEEPQVHPDVTLNAIADFAGAIFDNEFIVHGHGGVDVNYSVTARGEESGLTVQAAFGNPAVNIDQCANGDGATDACLGAAWQNGNVNGNQADYFEGDTIPYRDKFTDLTTGTTYSKTIEWDTTKSGKHAIDYLTTWNRSALPGSDPCDGTALAPCVDGSGANPLPIPDDPNVLAGPDGISGNSDDITPIPGVFECFGCTITNLSSYSLSGTYAGSSTTTLTISFTLDAGNTTGEAVLAWGG